ncbi:hypothetical protein BDZ45DRAFT_777237 [Acephala macrosclerotiorum]|nr:hypothetical protein BDZ45DRAFT_777237 [Acephala macrosclerotiorum]
MTTEKFVDYYPEFNAFLRSDDFTGVFKQLSGAASPMLLFKDRSTTSQQGIGNGFTAHLDAPAYDHIGEIEHVTANLAVDAATLENGYLEVMPKFHKMDNKSLRRGQIHLRWEATHGWVAVPLEPGDIMFFGSHLAYRSGLNNANKLRAMVYATYASEAEWQGSGREIL